MTARTITLSGADSILKGNYTAGSAGWQIKGDGNAEFNNVTIRGTLATCTISSGNTITVIGNLESNTYSGGVSGWKLFGGDGSAIFRTTITTFGINASTIVCQNIQLTRVYFGDTSHFLYLSGSVLYYFDGSTSHALY